VKDGGAKWGEKGNSKFSKAKENPDERCGQVGFRTERGSREEGGDRKQKENEARKSCQLVISSGMAKKKG